MSENICWNIITLFLPKSLTIPYNKFGFANFIHTVIFYVYQEILLSRHFTGKIFLGTFSIVVEKNRLISYKLFITGAIKKVIFLLGR